MLTSGDGWVSKLTCSEGRRGKHSSPLSSHTSQDDKLQSSSGSWSTNSAQRNKNKTKNTFLINTLITHCSYFHPGVTQQVAPAISQGKARVCKWDLMMKQMVRNVFLLWTPPPPCDQQQRTTTLFFNYIQTCEWL